MFSEEFVDKVEGIAQNLKFLQMQARQAPARRR
jgi:hypothetical protein